MERLVSVISTSMFFESNAFFRIDIDFDSIMISAIITGKETSSRLSEDQKTYILKTLFLEKDSGVYMFDYDTISKFLLISSPYVIKFLGKIGNEMARSVSTFVNVLNDKYRHRTIKLMKFQESVQTRSYETLINDFVTQIRANQEITANKKEQLVRKIREIYDRPVQNTEIKLMRSSCDMETYNRLWKDRDYGAIVATCIYMGCLKKKLSMETLRTTWMELAERIKRIVGVFEQKSGNKPRFYNVYQVLYDVSSCNYEYKNYNFLTDIQEHRALNCVGGTLLAFTLDRFCNMTFKKVLCSTEDHLFIVFKQGDKIYEFESTLPSNSIKLYDQTKRNEIQFQITSPHVMALYILETSFYATTNQGVDLTEMLGDYNQKFLDFAKNAQKPILITNMDADAFLYVLFIYYTRHYNLKAGQTVTMSQLWKSYKDCRIEDLTESRNSFFDGIPQNPEKVFNLQLARLNDIVKKFEFARTNKYVWTDWER